jgi:hypothetical protein
MERQILAPSGFANGSVEPILSALVVLAPPFLVLNAVRSDRAFAAKPGQLLP